MLSIRFVSIGFTIVLTGLQALAGGVRIAQRPQLPPFGSIQQAIDCAIDGETLIVGAGTYQGFEIENRKLAIAAAPGATVTVQGTVKINGLGALRWVVLSRLSISGAALPDTHNGTVSLPALTMDSNNGHVWLFDCTLAGGVGLVPSGPNHDYYGSGGTAAVVNASARVVLTRCTVQGGNGASDNNQFAYETYGGDGGEGIDATDSALALYQCTVKGGNGGHGGTEGGRGGHALDVKGFGVYVGGCTVTGGNGGKTWDYLVYDNFADGGHGVLVDINAQAQILDSVLTGGHAGVCSFCSLPGNDGLPTSGAGVIVAHSGLSRRFNATALNLEGSRWQITATGVPGDRVFVLDADAPTYVVPQPVLGVWVVPQPTAVRDFLIGKIPASGTLVKQIMLPAVTSGSAQSRFLQGGVLDAARTLWPSTPFFRVLLDAQATPDCNGNGVNDLADVLFSGATDLDHDLVPDLCDPDCNSNGVIDGLDISQGTSTDVDRDLVPDSCETNQTWYVDAASPQGGDGSINAPFRGLRPAVNGSLSGDTVIVADGLYQRDTERGLDFNGKSLVVRSANGSSSCTIDLLGKGRAFRLGSNEPAAEIRGFTMRNGFASTVHTSFNDTNYGGAILADAASPRIVDCVFDGSTGASAGGAIYMRGGRLENCTFRDNVAQTQSLNGSGGAVYTNGDTLIARCVFDDNSSQEGGALTAGYANGVDLTIFSSVFTNNTAVGFGGAIVYRTGFSNPKCLIADSLIAGNSCAYGGGALYTSAWFGGQTQIVELRGTTVVGNSASQVGSAMYIGGGAQVDVRNSIVWGNVSPGGQAFADGYVAAATSLAIGYTDWQGGASSVITVHGATATWLPGDIDLDPAFQSPAGPDGNPATVLDNDYRLAAGSPCIDAGDSASVAADLADDDHDGNTSEAHPFDLAGNARVVDDPFTPDSGPLSPAVDLGSYEHP